MFTVPDDRSLRPKLGRVDPSVDSIPGLSAWLVDGGLPVPSHGLPSVLVAVQISPLYKDNNDVGLGPTLSQYDLISLNYIGNDPVSK